MVIFIVSLLVSWTIFRDFWKVFKINWYPQNKLNDEIRKRWTLQAVTIFSLPFYFIVLYQSTAKKGLQNYKLSSSRKSDVDFLSSKCMKCENIHGVWSKTYKRDNSWLNKQIDSGNVNTQKKIFWELCYEYYTAAIFNTTRFRQNIFLYLVGQQLWHCIKFLSYFHHTFFISHLMTISQFIEVI